MTYRDKAYRNRYKKRLAKKKIKMKYKAWRKYSMEDQEKISSKYDVILEGYKTGEEKKKERRAKLKEYGKNTIIALRLMGKELMKDRSKKSSGRKRRRKRQDLGKELNRIWNGDSYESSRRSTPKIWQNDKVDLW